MAFSQDYQSNKGYQEINRTNLFDKQQTDPIPEILGDDVIPESPKDQYMRSEQFKHLPRIQREFIQNLEL